MNKVILLNKKIGQTPLAVLQQFQAQNPEYAGVKLSYMGRLDPMAEGLLLVLAGEENKHREKYLGLDKEYEFEVLFGVETDTYDILGLVIPRGVIPNLFRNLPRDVPEEILKQVQDDTNRMVGPRIQPYPPYSSKTVHGKPLFQYARENKLEDIEIPSRKITIYSIKVLEDYRIDQLDLYEIIKQRISWVKGDFRQKEILEGWEKFFADKQGQEFLVMKFAISCSSGTYVRSLAHELGKKLGTGAIALGIKRTKLGEYSLQTATAQ